MAIVTPDDVLVSWRSDRKNGLAVSERSCDGTADTIRL